jgi:hypothetical protein
MGMSSQLHALAALPLKKDTPILERLNFSVNLVITVEISELRAYTFT